MENRLDLVWQSHKSLYFGNKNKWKKNCHDDTLLFTKIMSKNTEIDNNIFVFDVYYQSITRKIYLTITLKKETSFPFSYYFHIYCSQSGNQLKKICRVQSTKMDLIYLKDLIDNKRCKELQIKCYLKSININGQKKFLKKLIDEYLLRYIHRNMSQIYLIEYNDPKWAIICEYDNDDYDLRMYLQLLLIPYEISKLDVRCSIEIKTDDPKANGLIFERQHTFSTRFTKSQYSNFRWRGLDPAYYKQMGQLSHEILSRMNQLSFHVTIQVVNVYDNQQEKQLKELHWSKYAII